MASPYTPTPTALPATVDLPDDGDAPEASLFNVPYEAILDALALAEQGRQWFQTALSQNSALSSNTVADNGTIALTTLAGTPPTTQSGGFGTPGPSYGHMTVPAVGLYKITISAFVDVVAGADASIGIYTQDGPGGTSRFHSRARAKVVGTEAHISHSVILDLATYGAAPDNVRIKLVNLSGVSFDLLDGYTAGAYDVRSNFLLVERLPAP